jgi:hypothetical protein
MTFGLTGWLKSQHRSIDYEIPLWYPSKDYPDSREWLSTNGLGGYSMGTVSGMNRRRYHASLVSALTPPVDRKVVLSRIEELVTINGKAYDLATILLTGIDSGAVTRDALLEFVRGYAGQGLAREYQWTDTGELTSNMIWIYKVQ